MAVLLKVAEPSSSLFAVHRPNTGRQARSEKLKLLQKKYSKVEPEEAEKWWNMQYESSVSVCSHAFWSVAVATSNSVPGPSRGERKAGYKDTCPTHFVSGSKVSGFLHP